MNLMPLVFSAPPKAWVSSSISESVRGQATVLTGSSSLPVPGGSWPALPRPVRAKKTSSRSGLWMESVSTAIEWSSIRSSGALRSGRCRRPGSAGSARPGWAARRAEPGQPRRAPPRVRGLQADVPAGDEAFELVRGNPASARRAESLNTGSAGIRAADVVCVPPVRTPADPADEVGDLDAKRAEQRGGVVRHLLAAQWPIEVASMTVALQLDGHDASCLGGGGQRPPEAALHRAHGAVQQHQRTAGWAPEPRIAAGHAQPVPSACWSSGQAWCRSCCQYD